MSLSIALMKYSIFSVRSGRIYMLTVFTSYNVSTAHGALGLKGLLVIKRRGDSFICSSDSSTCFMTHSQHFFLVEGHCKEVLEDERYVVARVELVVELMVSVLNLDIQLLDRNVFVKGGRDKTILLTLHVKLFICNVTSQRR